MYFFSIYNLSVGANIIMVNVKREETLLDYAFLCHVMNVLMLRAHRNVSLSRLIGVASTVTALY